MADALSTKRVLIFGGGGVHPHREACPLLQEYLTALPGVETEIVTEDYDALRAERLAEVDAVVMYHTGHTLTVEQRRGLLERVAEGMGFVGVHGAVCSFENAPEYLAMLGGNFRAHPFVRDYRVSLTDYTHPITQALSGFSVKDWEKWPVYEYTVTDEQYLIDYDARVRVLATALFRGVSWPVAWVKPWSKGKVFYLALGHDANACRDAFFQAIFINGAAWVLSDEPYEALPSNRFAIS